jgi:hypothetical protein
VDARSHGILKCSCEGHSISVLDLYCASPAPIVGPLCLSGLNSLTWLVRTVTVTERDQTAEDDVL